MPIIRGHILPEIEKSGRAKKFLDVLVWGSAWTRKDADRLHEVAILSEYLQTIQPLECVIRFHVPRDHQATRDLFSSLAINHADTQISDATDEVRKISQDEELARAVCTAVDGDADLLLIANRDWFPYIGDIEELGVLLTDSDFLKPCCEIFVRGHDVPWSFSSPATKQTWNGFYHFSEPSSLKQGLDFCYQANKKGASRETQETARSLVNNRIPNICFTRDRLNFYQSQKLVSKRKGWQRQKFAFETSYYLNFYYPLLFGGFDHLALLVNHCLQLGVADKNVGATYQGFLGILGQKNPSLYALFTEPRFVTFVKRVGYLRHYASHRGSLAPGPLLKELDHEPSDSELDAEIEKDGADITYRNLPSGNLRSELQEMVRSNFRMRHYEKGVIAEDLVLIETDGKYGFISPIVDTPWNFERFISFVNSVLAELTKSR